MRRGCGGGEEGLRLREETGCGRTATSHKPHEAGVGPEGPPIQQPEPAMSIPRSVAEVLKDHVTLELEGIDRLYLNVYVPKLQHELGVVSFFRFHRGYTFASSALMDPISKAFIADIERFVAARGIPLIAFGKGQRKDDLARAHLARFAGDEGVLFVGKAQEKTPVVRTEQRRHPQTGRSYAWIVRP